MNTNQEYASQMGFLKTYAENVEKKKKMIDGLKKQMLELKPQVDLFNALTEEVEDLSKSIRLDEKFLVSMNDMVLRNTGRPISDGPLFDASTGSASTSPEPVNGEDKERAA